MTKIFKHPDMLKTGEQIKLLPKKAELPIDPDGKDGADIVIADPDGPLPEAVVPDGENEILPDREVTGFKMSGEIEQAASAEPSLAEDHHPTDLNRRDFLNIKKIREQLAAAQNASASVEIEYEQQVPAVVADVKAPQTENGKGNTRRGFLKGAMAAIFTLVAGKAYGKSPHNIDQRMMRWDPEYYRKYMQKHPEQRPAKPSGKASVKQETKPKPEENKPKPEENRSKPDNTKEKPPETPLTPEEWERLTKISDQVNDSIEQILHSDYCPHDFLTMELSIAQQLAESDFDEDAVSPTGAVGTYQNLRDSIIDSVRYHADLKRKRLKLGKTGGVSESFRYDGPSDIDPRTASKIKQVILTNGDYGRAYGKTYMMYLFDRMQKRKGIDRKKFNHRDQQKELKIILACYNQGEGKILGIPEVLWPAEAKGYIKRIEKLLEEIEMTKAILANYGIKLPTPTRNYFLMKTVQNSKGNTSKMDYWVKKLLNDKIKAKGIDNLTIEDIQEMFPEKKKKTYAKLK